MARVTVEDCLARVPNRFALTILGSRRARALSEGRGRAMVDCDNKDGVTALREISADRVRFKEEVADTMVSFIEEQRRQLRVTTGEHTFLEAASLRALEDEDADEEEDASDIEELQSDPEALAKQATKGIEGEEVEDEEAEEEDEEEPDEEFDGEDAPLDTEDVAEEPAEPEDE